MLIAHGGLGDDGDRALQRSITSLSPRAVHSVSVRLLSDGQEVLALAGDSSRRIASVSKLFTAATAMQRLGPNYRFRTLFYADKVVGPSVGTLYIRGMGDPLLISEEWRLIAAALPVLEIRDGIVVDDSYFAPGLELIREEGVSNPYNARNGAFATNFNTLQVVVQGRHVQGEPQTPLTSFTVFELDPQRRGLMHVDTRQDDTRLTIHLRGPFADRPRKVRFNLGHDARTPALYAGHLFANLFVQGGGVLGSPEIRRDPVPADAQLLYVHESTRTLAEISRDLFEFSNNFVANQVFLVMGAEVEAPPAEVSKSRDLLRRELDAVLGPGAVSLAEGSGLDPRNRATASAITRYLRWLPERLPGFVGLLSPRLDGRVRVKTGTFRDEGVRAMAGYLMTPDDRPYASFALLCDSKRCPRNSFDRYERVLQDVLTRLPPPPLADAGAGDAR
ncbi:MAG: D-alanyl-D-alanine carboxypeptidase [Pseudomonadota bacterium]